MAQLITGIRLERQTAKRGPAEVRYVETEAEAVALEFDGYVRQAPEADEKSKPKPSGSGS